MGWAKGNWVKWWTSMCLAALATACGNITVDANVGTQGDVAGPKSDLLSTEGVDSNADQVGAEDGATDPQCLTDYDCVGLIAVTSCQALRCQEGSCVTALHPAGTLCVDPKVTTGECTEARCSTDGACTAMAVGDGLNCGLGVCGKSCQGGECLPTPPSAYDDGNPCTKDYCNQGFAVVHEALTDLTMVCSDGEPCTSGDTCLAGVCTGGPANCSDGIACTLDSCVQGVGCSHQANASACNDANPCTQDGCDLALGCTGTAAEVTVTCDDGNACTVADHCNGQGSCTGTKSCSCKVDADCQNDNLCLGIQTCVAEVCEVDPAQVVTCPPSTGPCVAIACNPKSGACEVSLLTDGAACDDNMACSAESVCKQGVCTSTAPLSCDDKNPCTADACQPPLGCSHEPASGTCNDGDACTAGDSCQKGGCIGAQTNCDDLMPCTLDGCNSGTGACLHTADASVCDDGNPCTKDSCNATKGCESVADPAATCSDGNACTQDSCSSGLCISVNTCNCSSDAACDDGNPCTIDSCVQGKCASNAAPMESKACSPTDKCQQPMSGSCAAGVCQSGSKPVDCSSAASACGIGVCNPSTGSCEVITKADGTACDADGSGCTVADACKAGQCAKGTPADCSEFMDACNAAICDSTGPTSFVCTKQAVPLATSCEDGLFCTLGDACDGKGNCLPGAAAPCPGNGPCDVAACDEATQACGLKGAPSSTPCDDGVYCTVGDHCDGNGACVPGGPKPCAGANCLVGQCQEATQSCKNATAPAGTPCEDGNACTQDDVCGGSGACASGTGKLCEGDACHSAACDPATGACLLSPLLAGTACNDGLPCTTSDACDAGGTCVGGPLKFCAGDACNDGACDPGSGACGLKPRADGSACDDGNLCTIADACSGGLCKGTSNCPCTPLSGFFDCNDNNTCTLDQCIASPFGFACQNLAQPGTACSDAKPCTSGDTCTSGGSCVGTPVSCDDGSACTLDACDPSTGACGHLANTGLGCTDGNPCTLSDTCDGFGMCSGKAMICNDGNVCTSDYCATTSGSCVFSPAVATCSDGNGCTVGDACIGASCVAGMPKNCDDSNPCTSDTCDLVSGACAHPANKNPCNDGSACTKNDVCSGGVCTAGLSILCDDSDICTDDACNPLSGGCVFVHNMAPCDDGDGCTVGDVCKFGACASGVAQTCDDGNVCTNDSCDSPSGTCINIPNSLACDDGSACTVGDVCVSGACTAGGPLLCNDANPCTYNKCDAASGCIYPEMPDGTKCGSLICGFPKTICILSCFAGICENPYR